MLLAIDTSTRLVGLCLLDGRDVVTELVWRSDLNHTRELLPRLQGLLEIGGTRKDGDLLAGVDSVAVAIGPGGYGGLRVGVSTAKALAFSRNLKLVGVDTLAAQAAGCVGQGHRVWAALPAGRGELAVGRYAIASFGWEVVDPPALMTAEALARNADPEEIIIGELPVEIVAFLRERTETPVISGPQAVRRPANVGWIGSFRLNTGTYDDPASLQPIYLRRPAITESRRSRRAAEERDDPSRGRHSGWR